MDINYTVRKKTEQIITEKMLNDALEITIRNLEIEKIVQVALLDILTKRIDNIVYAAIEDIIKDLL